MAEQLTLFDAMRLPPQPKRVDPDGPVFRGRVHTVLCLEHPKMAWDQARIEVHPIRESWMWSTNFNTGKSGSSYQIGEKWGNFAATREDAIYWACKEIRDRLCGREETRGTRAILSWLDDIEATL